MKITIRYSALVLVTISLIISSCKTQQKVQNSESENKPEVVETEIPVEDKTDEIDTTTPA